MSRTVAVLSIALLAFAAVAAQDDKPPPAAPERPQEAKPEAGGAAPSPKQQVNPAPPAAGLKSALVRADQAVPTRGEWGHWLRHLRGDTAGARDLVVLAVTLRPGQAPHPPHQHADEELMILSDGAGSWHLDGQDIAARQGDVVYAAPWTMHGVKNTGDTPLTYYMVKWNGKEPAAAQPATPAAEKQPAADPSKVVRDLVKGSIHHGRGMNPQWQRLTGKVRVIDANTLEFADGTRIELDITVPLPDQMGLIDGTLYPAGKQAAEYLAKFIGRQPVMCFKNDRDGPWMGYVGDTNLERAMIVGGWALADHSSLHADEIIARENKRGLWRGEFALPEEWLAGVRLPGETPPTKIADERQANELLRNNGRSDAARAVLVARIVKDLPTIRRLDFGGLPLSDDLLAQLARLTALEEVTLGAGVTNAGLAHLAVLTRLRKLNLAWTKTTDSGLQHLARLTELSDLALGETVSTADLSQLTGLAKLRRLTLYRTRVTDESLAHLRGHMGLEVLDLERAPITDAGIAILKSLVNLKYLDASGTEITDAAAEQLQGLKHLRVLKLPDRVSDTARNQLREGIPDLKFDGKPEDVNP